MAQMTSQERITAALEGREVDHIPFCPFLAYIWEHFPQDIQDAGQLAFHHLVGADPLWRGAPCPVRAVPPEVETRRVEDDRHILEETTTPVGTLRQQWTKSKTGNTAFLVEHPLKREQDFQVMLWLEEHTRFELDLGPFHEHMAGAGAEGVSIGMLVPRCKTAFQSMIESYVGTEELVYALADYPDTVETLWRTMAENNLRAAQLALEAGYTYYLTWEDSGTQNYSPALYERYISPEIREWCALLEANGKHYIQHACGHVRGLLGYMQADGVHTVESLSPPPTGNISLREARQRLGSGVGIIGGIEPTMFLQLSLEELGPYVEQVIADGSGGPFVLANSDSCPPGVTVEKFRLVADIAKSAR
jgi:hypothetical protein